ncbi:unnamed protein product [Cylicostephanus goldi]|uniref:MARVEL domain-containing protein n=1 Tax=Cylicostephanus goldi TaxID=71465 RepID=A0A3P7MDN1_CYLGO|nr:unnamed protein product [Cylicostephanus goldi]
MNFEFLRTIHGFINVLQVCFGFAAIFASSLIWNNSNLYFQFIYQGFGWQTLILFILVITFIFNFIVFLSNLFGKDVLGTLLLMYAICLVLLIISASLETWYCGKSAGYIHSRFVAVTVSFTRFISSFHLSASIAKYVLDLQLVTRSQLHCPTRGDYTICIR